MEQVKLNKTPRKTRSPAKKEHIDPQELVQQLIDLRIELKSAESRAKTERDTAQSLQADHKALRIELENEQGKTVALKGRIGVLEANEVIYKNMEINYRILQAVHKIVDDDRVAFIGMVGNALNSVIQEAPPSKATETLENFG